MKYIWQFAVLFKRLLTFVGSLVFIYGVYRLLIPDTFRRADILLIAIVLWLFTAYVVLPRAHRFLSRIYVPDYFIARTRTADGFLSDPINLALNGTKANLIAAMKRAGWQEAVSITPKSIWKMAYTSALGKSYPDAPVTDAFLFGKKQDLAFQMQVANNPRQRHHVRFWRAPAGWFLPGGYKVDWLGAATYDEALGLSFVTSQITHRIEAQVDKERDFLIEVLNKAKVIRNILYIEHFFPGHEARNGSGHRYYTDGSMVIADLSPRKKP